MAIWGMNYVTIRMGALEISPLLLLSIRFFLCGLIFLPFARAINKTQFLNIAKYALPFQGIHMGTLFLGLAEVDAALGALIMQVQLPFLILIGLVFYKERFGWKTAMGLIIAFIGGLILVYKPAPDAHVTVMGVVFLVISALTWAIGSARLKYVQDINFPTLMGSAFWIALPFVFVMSLMTESDHIAQLQGANSITLLIVLGFQVILVSISHYLWKIVIGRNPVYMATPFTILTPIFGVVFAVILLGEALSMTSVIGGGIALAGIVIVTFRKAEKAV